LGVESTTTLEIAKGEDRESVGKRVVVRLHTKELSEDAIVYRNGNQPITDGGTSYGQIVSAEQKADGTVIRTYTTESGTVTVTVNNNPGTVDEIVYQARLSAMSVPLIGPEDIPLAIGGTLGTLTGLGVCLIGRRYGAAA